MLPEEAIIEFQRIYLKELGVSLSNEEAEREAENFIQLYALVTEEKANSYED